MEELSEGLPRSCRAVLFGNTKTELYLDCQDMKNCYMPQDRGVLQGYVSELHQQSLRE